MIIPKIKSTGTAQKSSFDALAVDCNPTDNINTALVAMVGDAPNAIDVLKAEPFQGPAGSQLNRVCAAVRLARYQIYFTTACKAELPKNNTNRLWTEKGFRHADWGTLQKRLIDELAEFPGKFIMLLGPTAMKLLIDEPKFNSIQSYRGSCYKAEQFPHLREKLAGKIIGLSYHPSFTLFSGKPIHFYTMIADFAKMLKIIDDPELLTDNTEIIIRPGFEKVMQFYELIKTKKFAGFDIEATPKFMTCFSFAVYDDDKIKSMSIPLMDNRGSYWSTEEEVKIWRGMAEILGDPEIGKIMQNGMFDITYTLRTMGIMTDNFYFDTMLAQHICYTELPKSLAYLTSTYTNYPAYKDEGKQSHQKVIKDWETYWRYNAKDSAYLLPISEQLISELEDFESTDAMEYTMNLHKPLIEMEYNGILTDTEGILTAKTDYEVKILALQNDLNELAGKEINVNSSKQMIAYFYGICMIKPYINRKSGNATCGAVALHRIAKKQVKGSDEARIIIKLRKYQKLVSTYFTIDVDEDKKLRCHHKISGTVSGRIATEGTYFGTGANLQNQPYAFKYYLIPDKEHYLVEFDLAKAEAHVVAYLTQDVNMIDSFLSGIDVHSFNASKIFDLSIEEVIEEARTKKGSVTMRQMGKKVVHASNYAMGPQTFSDNLAKDEIFKSQSECKALLTAYTDRFPGLKRWHRSIEDEVQESRVLYNLFGRPRRFLSPMNAALFRNAYSYKPQSTVAELLNKGMIKMANDKRLGPDGFNLQMLTTVHDSVVVQFHKSQIPNLEQIFLIVRDHMTHTFTYKGKSFTIGLDAKIGTQWAGNTIEIDDFSQHVIEQAIERLKV